MPLRRHSNFARSAVFLEGVTTFPIVPGRDLMLTLGCDGIWDVMSDQGAGALALGHLRVALEKLAGRTGSCSIMNEKGVVVPAPKSPAAAAADGLVRESFQRYSMDNLTALCVNIRPTAKWFEKVEEDRKKNQVGSGYYS